MKSKRRVMGIVAMAVFLALGTFVDARQENARQDAGDGHDRFSGASRGNRYYAVESKDMGIDKEMADGREKKNEFPRRLSQKDWNTAGTDSKSFMGLE